MTKETLPIIILVATLVILLVSFAVFLWEPIYELQQSLELIRSLEDLPGRVDQLETSLLRDEARRDLAREILGDL
ncbi:MAG: hypothetical protein K9L21_05100 [Spirochaetia bacterium]|nr:hypothetical protein [Spirochaetia bacterium]